MMSTFPWLTFFRHCLLYADSLSKVGYWSRTHPLSCLSLKLLFHIHFPQIESMVGPATRLLMPFRTMPSMTAPASSSYYILPNSSCVPHYWDCLSASQARESSIVLPGHPDLIYTAGESFSALLLTHPKLCRWKPSEEVASLSPSPAVHTSKESTQTPRGSLSPSRDYSITQHAKHMWKPPCQVLLSTVQSSWFPWLPWSTLPTVHSLACSS